MMIKGQLVYSEQVQEIKCLKMARWI